MTTSEQIEATVAAMNLVQVRAVWNALGNRKWDSSCMYDPDAGVSMSDWAQMVKSHFERMGKTPTKLFIEHDQFTDCPLDEEDGSGWKLVSFSRKHSNSEPIDNYYDFDSEAKTITANAELQAKIDAGTAFELSYFEHGEGCWFQRGTGHARRLQCQWDTVQVAGILLCSEDWTPAGDTTLEKVIDSILEEYNEWCNGHCYFYSIKNGEEETLDSCGGFIGKYIVEHLKDEHSELWDGDSIKDGIEVTGECAFMVE